MKMTLTKMKCFDGLDDFILAAKTTMIFLSKIIQFVVMSTVVIFAFIVQWLLNLKPAFLEKFYEVTYSVMPMKDTKYPIKDFLNLYTTVEFPKTVIKLLFTDLFIRTAQEGKEAPNLGLIKLDGQSEHKILDLCKKGRPLVLSFGSCT